MQGIIAQCPMMDGMASAMAVLGYAGAGYLTRLAGHGMLDQLRGMLGLSPHYIPSAGRPGEIAAMSAEDAWPGYTALLPQGAPNRVAARIAARLMFFRPIKDAAKVRCPALIQICDRDTVAPASAAEKAATRMPAAEVCHYDTGHFDVYQGEEREKSLADQIAFLGRVFG